MLISLLLSKLLLPSRERERLDSLIATKTSTGAKIILRIDARARGLLDLWSHGLHAAWAQRLSQAATSRGTASVLQLRLQMLLLSFGLNILHAARAHLQVQATARVLDQMVVGGSARAVTRLIHAATSQIKAGLFEFRLNSVDFAAIALRLQKTVTERVGGLLHLGDKHRLGRWAASGLRARGSGHLKSELILRCPGDLNRAWGRTTRPTAERLQDIILAKDRQGLQ